MKCFHVHDLIRASATAVPTRWWGDGLIAHDGGRGQVAGTHRLWGLQEGMSPWRDREGVLLEGGHTPRLRGLCQQRARGKLGGWAGEQGPACSLGAGQAHSWCGKVVLLKRYGTWDKGTSVQGPVYSSPALPCL